MSHIVVIGAGTGGMSGVYEIREALSKSEHQVTLINEREDFQFVPSNPWLGVGWRKRAQISIPIKECVNKKGINFIAGRVTEIIAHKNQLKIDDTQTLDYDYLVIATGPELAFDQIEGAGPDGFTQSVCSLDHAEASYQNVNALIENPGAVVVGAFQGASCFGPAYEYAFILEKALRDAKVRDRVPMTFVTCEPYIGHLGLGGVGDSKGLLESDLRAHHIQWICNAKVTKVEAGKMYVEEYNDRKEVIKNHELVFKHSMLIPPFRGVAAVARVEGLCNAKGFVFVDEFQRSPQYQNIYAAGVCIAIAPLEDTPVPLGVPKTGYMIESMMTAIAENISDVIDGKAPSSKASWSAICLADMGDTGAAFVAIPQIPPRNVTWFKKGKWVHFAKVAFEKYFMMKMKNGTTEPIYEKYMLKLLGINKLK